MPKNAETNNVTTDPQSPVEDLRDATKKVGVDPKNPDDSTANREKQVLQDATPEPETFDREYVEKLRKEAADHRVKAKDRDDLARELFHARVAALGRLADPDDLPYDDTLVSDLPALEAAVEELLSRKPHLAARTPRGDVGSGVGGRSESVDLSAILRGAL